MHITTSQQNRVELGFGGFSCNWGTHIAGLYETDEQRDTIMFGFLRTGAKAGDLQLSVPAERSTEEFSADYASSCQDCHQHVNDPNIFCINTPRGLYFPNGHFDPIEMTKNLENFYLESQREERRNIRATANMTFALETFPGREHLMAYESRLNYFIPGKPWISICLYNLRKFRGDMIMQVLRTHPYTINGGVITANPYYQDPDSWLTEHAPQFLPDSKKR